MVVTEKVRDFNLDHIFDCGQCFRWNKEEDGSYTGIAFGRPVNICFEIDKEEENQGRLSIDNIDEKEFNQYWKSYLDLDRDYGQIKAVLGEKDLIMAEAIKSGQGIRILKQDPWETLVSFIISQNNNIPRIKKCIEGLCEMFGESAGNFRGKRYFAFPKPEALAQLTEVDLAPVKLGYRAKYIIETARRIAADNASHLKEEHTDLLTLEQLCHAETQKGYEYLMSLCGVGPKVANCILLFGMGKHESFPIDVWVRRVMHRLYGIEENDMKSMSDYASENFGQYGGIAQQYLFYHIRQLEK
ncbi:DNA-3-methyladenine glycosylase family protein [Aminipila terrae]|uniref:DNA-(apurinic or apyrimidinic site) lyase n=1 Tax=Aminipila terrae TaxID=2697030 RepID=A0A6P1MFZ8_9FIRM|nr:DNA glycosylase [Aminipila terrae]QHI72661.1 8-oxoguanine DNA glycosylase [Aminipila terrae]